MRRLLIGLGGLFFLLVTVVLVVPLFLPKDAIKQQVIAEVDKAVGWRLRLDGPVSLSLLPGFSLIAEKVGLSGEAGADGIEFAKAEKIEFGLAWAGLFGGDIQITQISLHQPDIFLEIAPSGTTSWAPRRDLTPAEEAAEILSGELVNPESQSAAPVAEAPSEDRAERTGRSAIERIRIDRLDIVDGRLVYHDVANAQRHEVSALNLTMTAPDLQGEVTLDSSFQWKELPATAKGSVTNPIGFLAGELVPVDVTVSVDETTLGAAGQIGIEPLRSDVAISGMGPSLKEALRLAGSELASDPGAFSIFSKVEGDEAAISLSDISASVGSLGADGHLDADLRGEVPAMSGRLVLRDSGLEDLLALAGQSFPAKGLLSGDISFEAAGAEPEALMATLNAKGAIRLKGGEVSGLGLADAMGGDTSADVVSDIALELDLNGLDETANLRGGLSWRGESFTVTGSATPAPLLDGRAAPVTVNVKGRKVAAGYQGTVSGAEGLSGAVSVETANLRELMAWMGQDVEAGSGLRNFKASGAMSVAGDTIRFEETRFSLDETSGEANGQVTFAERPVVKARLALNALVLDPYFGAGKGGQGASGGGGSAGEAGRATGNAAPQVSSRAQSGWSDAPIDFSGLNAADVDFSITTKEIRWDKIKIDESGLSATIRGGVLNAKLDTLRLYGGSGSGDVQVDGSAALPKVTAKFNLSDLSAYPVLADAADFEWIEGKANISLDVATQGASQRAMVQGLGGAAGFNFADGAIRGINIPKMVRGLSIETLLGWGGSSTEKTDFSSFVASFDIAQGVATNTDLSLVGPLIRMTGKGTTDMPNRTLNWRLEPKIVATLEGQAPTPRAKGSEKKLAGLGVPVVVEGSWDKPRVYPDIKGILENPEEAYKQLQNMGGELSKLLKGGKPDEQLVDAANEAIQKATGGKTQIDVQKVIEGDVDDKEILEAVEKGFGLPSGFLGSFGKKKN
ncbi:AsmA family protein [Roseibium sp.]|uniref:AsmA family protein n=1 Tax=Roseibium sp. TaxID=1936156 RepID=UPI003A98517D